MHSFLFLAVISALCWTSGAETASHKATSVNVGGTNSVMQRLRAHGFVHLIRRKLKDTLSRLCFLFNLIDLFEDVVETIPLLRKLSGRVGVHHSVLLLTASHMLHHSEDVLKGFDEQQSYHDKIEREKYIKKVLATKYKSAEDAAVAHDKAIVAVHKTEFPLAAALNYPYRIPEYMSVSGIKSVKYSIKHKGIYQDQRDNCWRVCDLSIGQPTSK